MASRLYLLTSWPRSFSCGAGLSTCSGMGMCVFKTEQKTRVVLWFVTVEHFSIAPHPKDFLLPNSCFAVAFWVSATVRMVCRNLQQATISTVSSQLPTVTNHYRMHEWASYASTQLPIVTDRVHVMAAQFWLVWIWHKEAYHLLPFVTRW